MQTLKGVVIYLKNHHPIAYPYLYVNRNMIYILLDDKDGSQFEKFDNKHVEVTGRLNIESEYISVESIYEVQ